MASPQKENGYTPIANEIMYALSKTSMPIKCRQVLDVIMQMTWGWSRKDAEISTDYFIEKTGMLRQRFQEAKSTLVSMNIITVSKHVYAIQKDHEKWNCPEIRSVKKERNPGQKRTESRTEKERNPGHATIGKTILKQKTSGVSTKDGITDEQYRKNFELLWSALPTDKKIRKQVAYKAYRRTVTSPQTTISVPLLCNITLKRIKGMRSDLYSAGRAFSKNGRISMSNTLNQEESLYLWLAQQWMQELAQENRELKKEIDHFKERYLERVKNGELQESLMCMEIIEMYQNARLILKERYDELKGAIARTEAIKRVFEKYRRDVAVTGRETGNGNNIQPGVEQTDMGASASQTVCCCGPDEPGQECIVWPDIDEPSESEQKDSVLLS